MRRQERGRIVSTAEGSRPEAFGPTEWGLLAAVALIWGSSFLLIEEGLESFAPTVVTAARLSLGAITLALFPASHGRIERRDRPRVLVLSLIWIAIPFVLFPVAQQWINSALAGMMNGAVPLFSAVIAALLLWRLPGRRQAIGLGIGFLGVVLIALPGLQVGGSTALGVALLLIATICYGVGLNLAVPLQQRYGTLPVIMRALVIAALITLPLGLLGLGDSSFTLRAAAALLVLGVLGSGVAFIAMATLVGRAGATRGSVAVYFIPVVAIVLGVTLRSESVALISILGVALVTAGAWLTSRKERTASGG